MKPIFWILIAAALLLCAGCMARLPQPGAPDPSTEPPAETDADESTTAVTADPGPACAVLRFSSFDGGGPEFQVSAEDPELLSWSALRDYGDQPHEEQTGSAYDWVLTLRGRKPGTTRLTVTGSSPIVEPESYVYTVTVDEALNLSLRPLRTLSRLSFYRNGSIDVDSYDIRYVQDGYLLTVSDERCGPISRETVDAIYEIFEKYDAAAWDGFRESAYGVLDGEGFWLELTLTDGTVIHASGENAFPPHYRDAVGEIWPILEEAALQATEPLP